MEDKNFTAYDWGVWWGERLGVLTELGYAVMAHTKPMLPRQRRAFERGFRYGVAHPKQKKAA